MRDDIAVPRLNAVGYGSYAGFADERKCTNEKRASLAARPFCEFVVD
jgi:hypothetical protein